ncbi:MAG: hypothetical protein BGN88_15475 [Clostridiales bacterium 43-6]|nr:MAG: hypothetical protein BGN88_15475 [Clostridiales bacterium 43-6]
MNTGFGDKELLEDALSSQKFVAENYTVFATECATKQVRDDVLTIMNEELNIQNELFTELHNRGWYQTPAAEAKKVEDAKQKFQQMQ